MLLLITFVLIALIFSFLCSIAEAVLLSVTSAHISILEKEEQPAGPLLKQLKADINKPLAAILTLNTIAHTTGAVGAGAEAAKVFGNEYVGIASAILTILILVLSEIIPKTIGATYWKNLAPSTAYFLNFLTWILYPFVILSEKITGSMVKESTMTGFSRQEFSVMAELSQEEGLIATTESNVLSNLMLLKDTCVEESMTPRTVVFSLNEDVTVEEFYHKYDQSPFSRTLVYQDDKDNITGFVIRSDLFLAQARGNGKNALAYYRRDIGALSNTVSHLQALKEMLRQKAQIMLIVNEYGTMEGIITMEDLFETLLGLEIIDERDKTMDMQKLAKKKWQDKVKERGIELKDDPKI